MALEYTVENLDGVDESLHSLYVAGDKGFTLSVNGLEDVSGLKSALKSERDINKENKVKLTDLEKLRDEAETKTLEEQGKYKDLFEGQKTQTLQSQKDFNALTMEVAKGKGKALVNALALSMTTDKNEIEIISRFAGDALTFEGKDASFSKPIEELKTELSRFVITKASGSNDGGNNNGDGNIQTKTRSEFANLKPAEQNKFIKDGGKVINN